MKPQLKTDTLAVACFAPPLTDELISRYESLAEGLPDSRGEVRDAMRECLRAIKVWWELPESTGERDDAKLAIRHRGKDVRVPVISLTRDLIDKLFDAVPWPYELTAMAGLLEGIDPAEKELRDAAFHLLWFCTELCHDREPLTQDKLPA